MNIHPEMELMKESLLYADSASYDYIDQYEYTLIDPQNQISVVQVGELFIEKGPKWIDYLFRLRDRIASLFNLKTVNTSDDQNEIELWKIGSRAGIFKVFDKAQNELVLGENDRHLDFRVSLLTQQEEQHKTIKVTTVVKFHNRLGRCYFFFIKPFHKAIIPLTLKPRFKKMEMRLKTSKD